MSAFNEHRPENKVPGQSTPDPQPPAPKRPHWLKRAVSSVIAAADSRPVLFFCLTIFSVTLLAYYPGRFGDYDVWFHLAYGRAHLQNLSWYIDHSQFSWTPANNEWIYVCWIGSSLLYLAHAAAGETGLWLFMAMIYVGMFACLILYARSAGFRLSITLLTALMLIFVTVKLLVLFIKPEIFTTLFFFAATTVYFHGKLTDKKDLYWIYPILFLIWVNTHGGFVAGLAFLGLAIAMETIARVFFPGQALPWPRYKKLAIFTGLAGAATLINPYGIVYHLDIFRVAFIDIFGTKEYMPLIAAYESVWKNMHFADGKIYWIVSGWSMVFMVISCAALLMVYMIRKKTFPLAIFALNLFFFFFSMSFGRTVIFYPPIWFCSMLYLLRERDVFHLPRLGIPLVLLIFMTLSLYAPYSHLLIEARKSWFGGGMEEAVPVKEVQFIMENHLPGPIFNDYVIGGYMIWAMYPEYKVFIDPRFTPYDKFLLNDYFGLQERYIPRKGGLRLLRDKYEFNIALLNLRALPMIEWMVNSPEWSLVYFDKVAAVLMHRSVLHTLSPKARAMDVGPQRFNDLSNPAILECLFNFYQNFGIGMATEIRNIYERNVSPIYFPKKLRIKLMDSLLEEKKLKQEMRNKDQGANISAMERTF